MEIITLHLQATNELPHLIELWKAAKSKNSPVPTSDEWDELATGLEVTARSIDAYNPRAVSPLLQTTAYARSMASALTKIIPSITVEKYLEQQQCQQAIVTNVENPVDLRATLDECALTWPVAPAPVMAEQYAHLLDLASLPNVTIRVIPAEVCEHAGVSVSAFRLLHSQYSTVAVLDTPHSGQVYEDRRTVEYFERISQYVRSLAQEPDQTRTLISRLAGRTSEQ